MKKRRPNKKGRSILHMLQHLLILIAAAALLVLFTGSGVLLKGVDGNYSYRMEMGEKEVAYEESALFNFIMGRGVSDVARMVAVRSQLETNGKFDGRKEIDVAFFFHRFEGIPDEYVTARYYLEDLIKWGQHGFDQEERQFTTAEAADFLNDSSEYSWTEDSLAYSGIATPFNSDIEQRVHRTSVPANDLLNLGYSRGEGEIEVLFNRYPSVEGKHVEDYTATWEDYQALSKYVTYTARDLSNNYQEYQRYQEFYDLQHTNLRYYIIKRLGDRQEIYTNLSWRGSSEEEVTRQFQQFGKFLYFQPAEMNYETNTLIQEDTIRHLFNAFEYAYPENMSVWVGVDTSYPVSDVYIQGRAGYHSYVPYYFQLLILAAVCLFFYVWNMIYLTMKEGWDVDEEGRAYIRLKKIDHIPTEITIFGTILILGGILTVLVSVYDSRSREFYYTDWFLVVGTMAVLFCEILFSILYYSQIRRLKGDNFWKDSFTYMIWKKTGRIASEVTSSKRLVVRIWVPYVLFLLIHYLFLMTGKSLLLLLLIPDIVIGVCLYRNAKVRQKIIDGIEQIRDGDLNYKVDETGLRGDNLILSQAVNRIGEGIRTAVETSRKDERMKADLITNVSHDIKTPLTSIINYVDLIKRENTENEKVRGYVEVLDEKSKRLKQLTDDLVEASKISSGVIALEWERVNLGELADQTMGEFTEKFQEKGLTPVMHIAREDSYILADGRRIWRVMENLLNNIFKYAMDGTRVYLVVQRIRDVRGQDLVELSLKNISAQPLDIQPEELTERFIRGDQSRSTEGSGLGLSIAKSLTELQKGQLEIQLDGDLFKVILHFPFYAQPAEAGEVQGR